MNIVTLLPQTHCSLTYPPPHTFPVLLPLLGVSWSKVIFTYSKRLLTKAGFVAVGLMSAHPSGWVTSDQQSRNQRYTGRSLVRCRLNA